LGLDIDLNELVGANSVPESGPGNAIEFDFSDSHLNLSSRKRAT
jgi:hypothetical protein